MKEQKAVLMAVPDDSFITTVPLLIGTNASMKMFEHTLPIALAGICNFKATDKNGSIGFLKTSCDISTEHLARKRNHSR